MNEQYIEDRRRYIQQVKQSFDNQSEKKNTYEDNWEKEEVEVSNLSFLKVRILLAIILFAAFVLCDRTDTKLFQYTSAQITDKIEENINIDMDQVLSEFK